MRHFILLLSILYNFTAIAAPLKVLVIDTNPELVRALRDEQYEVTTLSLAEKLQDFPPLHNVITLPKWVGPDLKNSHQALSFRIYRFLKDKEYDIIFFPSTNGCGYYLTEAKKQGYGFENTVLVSYAAEPIEWLWDISDMMVSSTDFNTAPEIEQRSTEQADIAILPSEFAYNLLSDKGWVFPKDTKILPPLYTPISNNSDLTEDSKIQEIVFIGPCDFRSGCDLFIQTIKKAHDLNPKLMDGVKITILNEGAPKPEAAKIEKMDKITYHNDQNYIEYLKDPSRLTLFTSRQELGSYVNYAAMHERARFIGMSNGFLDEIIGNKNYLVQASNSSSLARKLIYSLEHTAMPPLPKTSLENDRKKWRNFLSSLKLALLKFKTNALSSKQEDPFVSICITHLNRPEQLMEVLIAFDKQSYKNFEVIVMDDGSTPEVIKKLQGETASFMKERGWRIFYQENQFISRARNNLAPYAKGPLILLFEDDDLPIADTIERFVRVKQRTQADIVNTNMAIAKEEKSRVSKLVLILGSHVASIFGENNIGFSAAALISKKLFQELSGYLDSYGFICSDMEFYIRAAAKGAKIATSVEPAYIHNSIGEDHWFQKGYSAYYQARTTFNAYQNKLPKEFRNVPFWGYSFRMSAAIESKRSLEEFIFDFPLWKIILIRYNRMIDGFFDYIMDHVHYIIGEKTVSKRQQDA